MIGPTIGRELVRARVEGFHAEAVCDRRARRSRGARRMRLALGARLVSAGSRLLGQPAELR